MGWNEGFRLIKGCANPLFKGLELMIGGLEKWLITIKKEVQMCLCVWGLAFVELGRAKKGLR